MSSFCKCYSHFFSKKFQHIRASLDVNFNESLTNDDVSFEQLGPGPRWMDFMLVLMKGAVSTHPDQVHYCFPIETLDSSKLNECNGNRLFIYRHNHNLSPLSSIQAKIDINQK